MLQPDYHSWTIEQKETTCWVPIHAFTSIWLFAGPSATIWLGIHTYYCCGGRSAQWWPIVVLFQVWVCSCCNYVCENLVRDNPEILILCNYSEFYVIIVNHSSLQRNISISLNIFINIYPLNLLFYHSSPKKRAKSWTPDTCLRQFPCRRGSTSGGRTQQQATMRCIGNQVLGQLPGRCCDHLGKSWDVHAKFLGKIGNT